MSSLRSRADIGTNAMASRRSRVTSRLVRSGRQVRVSRSGSMVLRSTLACLDRRLRAGWSSSPACSSESPDRPTPAGRASRPAGVLRAVDPSAADRVPELVVRAGGLEHGRRDVAPVDVDRAEGLPAARVLLLDYDLHRPVVRLGQVDRGGVALLQDSAPGVDAVEEDVRLVGAGDILLANAVQRRELDSGHVVYPSSRSDPRGHPVVGTFGAGGKPSVNADPAYSWGGLVTGIKRGDGASNGR